MTTLRGFLIFIAAAALVGCGGGGGGGTAAPSGPPVVAPPPPPSDQPPTSNLVTLQSDAGDTIGQGKSYSYTSVDSAISVKGGSNHIVVTVDGDQQWSADFATGGTDTQLKPGMYSDLDAYVPSSPGMPPSTKAGLRWFGEGRGCTTSKGWFAIDSVTYTGSVLTAIALRFERHCDGAAAALRGDVKFTTSDLTTPPPPVNPPPSDLWRPPADVGTSQGNYVYLESSAGDYVGLGKTYRYDSSNSNVWATGGGGMVYVGVGADEWWSGRFKAMGLPARVEPGYYPGLRSHPFSNPVKGGLSWAGGGRGCITLQGWFAIDAIKYDANNQMVSVDLRFEQRCEGRTATLRGALHWAAAPPYDPVSPPASAVGSWHPPAGVAPANGNYFYLDGDPSGIPGYRNRYLNTAADAVFAAFTDGGYLQADIKGAQQWVGHYQLPTSNGQIQPGLYDGLPRFMYPGQPTSGEDWNGEQRGCGDSSGWLAIDSISYSAGKLSAVDLRFEQVCNGTPLPLHGVLHWRADDTVVPPGPSTTPPAEFWRPAAGTVPAAGNYVYLQSDRSDFIGAGATYKYTPADTIISISETAGYVEVKVDGDEHWTGNFKTMSSLDHLQPGYYGSLREYMVHDPAIGGFSWYGEGRGCNTQEAGVIVDSVSYENGKLSALQMRFEQHCETNPGALRGEIRWAASDRSAAPGPVMPIPPALWRPPAGVTPASGNYVYLQSEPGDFIGDGKTFINTPQNAQITASVDGGRLHVAVDAGIGTDGKFESYFVPMNTLAQPQAGFYDQLRMWPIFNPARGGMTWSGRGHGCNSGISWLAIDSITYANGILTSLNARFEQHCDFRTPALRGEIHWAG